MKNLNLNRTKSKVGFSGHWKTEEKKGEERDN